jgi:hypothetical protein
VRAWWIVFVAGCGARTGLDVNDDAATHAPRDAAVVDHVSSDVVQPDVVHEDVVVGTACVVTADDPSFGATQPLDSCSEAQNDSSVASSCSTISVAWEYVPAHDMDVTRLELDVIGGGVALYDSDNGAPGTKLFEGSFDSGAQAWRGADVSPPIHLAACHMYFIQQVTTGNQYEPCSVANDGTAQRQFNPPGFDGPGWSGPYIWLDWSAHVIGTCP